jgi:ankyrin repeat protein
LAEHLIGKHPEHVNSMGGIYATPMLVAARRGYVDILALLIKHGVDVDSRGSYDETPLHRALGQGKLEAGQYLIDHGADIDACDKDGWTSLHWAIPTRNNHKQEAVRWVLEHRNDSTDVNACDKSGESPSEMAARLGQQEIVELLSEYGAKPVM